jgi:outer membrane protein OmpA-like peptidoglycan-associated protein
MNRQLLQGAMLVVGAGALAALASSCARMPGVEADAEPNMSTTRGSESTPARLRLSAGVGQQTSALGSQFVVCSPCEPPSPKTLATVRLPSRPPQAAGPSALTESFRHLRTSVGFRFDSAQLSSAARDKLLQLAPLLRAAKRIRMIGFTDDLGSRQRNDSLARERARQVHDLVQSLLGDRPVPELSSRGDAMCCYVSGNVNEAQRAANRRVEVLITAAASAQTSELAARLAPLLQPAGSAASEGEAGSGLEGTPEGRQDVGLARTPALGTTASVAPLGASFDDKGDQP